MFFFICIKIYQLNITNKIKKYYQKELVKDIKIFLKKKKRKKKNDNMVVNVTKTSQKRKSKSLLSIEKNIIK